MNFANIDIKKYIAEKGYTQAQVADKLGISHEYMSRVLKIELTDFEKEALKKAIDGDISEWKAIKHHRCKNCLFYCKAEVIE